MIKRYESLTKTGIDKVKQAKETYGLIFGSILIILLIFGQMMGKFSLNQIPTLNHKFIANSFILIRPSIRWQSLSYESFGGLFYMLGDL